MGDDPNSNSSTSHASSSKPSERPDLILKKPLVLVGLMGVGKTTIGRRLAEHLKLPFVDADEEIEKAAGQNIANIFDSFGEAGFRDGEHRVIARILDSSPRVLATGGGAMTHPLTREILKQRAITLWLRTDLQVLARRVANRNHRPLLKNKDPLEVLKAHAETRYPLYDQADLKVDTGDMTHAKTVDLVLDALKLYLDQGS